MYIVIWFLMHSIYVCIYMHDIHWCISCESNPGFANSKVFQNLCLWHDMMAFFGPKSVHLNPPKTSKLRGSNDLWVGFGVDVLYPSTSGFMQPFFGVGGVDWGCGLGTEIEELLVASLFGAFFLQWGVCWIDWFIFWGFDSAKSGASKISPFFFRRVFSNYRWICSWHADFHSSKTVGWKNEISSCIPSGLFTKYDSAGFPCGFHVFQQKFCCWRVLLAFRRINAWLEVLFMWKKWGKSYLFCSGGFPLLLLPFK